MIKDLNKLLNLMEKYNPNLRLYREKETGVDYNSLDGTHKFNESPYKRSFSPFPCQYFDNPPNKILSETDKRVYASTYNGSLNVSLPLLETRLKKGQTHLLLEILCALKYTMIEYLNNCTYVTVFEKDRCLVNDIRAYNTMELLDFDAKVTKLIQELNKEDGNPHDKLERGHIVLDEMEELLVRFFSNPYLLTLYRMANTHVIFEGADGLGKTPFSKMFLKEMGMETICNRLSVFEVNNVRRYCKNNALESLFMLKCHLDPECHELDYLMKASKYDSTISLETRQLFNLMNMIKESNYYIRNYLYFAENILPSELPFVLSQDRCILSTFIYSLIDDEKEYESGEEIWEAIKNLNVYKAYMAMGDSVRPHGLAKHTSMFINTHIIILYNETQLSKEKKDDHFEKKGNFDKINKYYKLLGEFLFKKRDIMENIIVLDQKDRSMEEVMKEIKSIINNFPLYKVDHSTKGVNTKNYKSAKLASHYIHRTKE